MRRAEKAHAIQKILNRLYPVMEQSFLDHQDDYTLLVAVLLSAQCKDERVNQTTPALWAKADSPAAMITLDIEEIRQVIKPCGLAPTKAKNIWNLSKMILDDFNGQVPSNLEDLEKLPGVGHKTASVVMAQAFGEPMFPVDTHIHRLAGRWSLSKARNVVETERDLKRLFPKETWNLLHLQLIQFGRDHCPALYHDLTTCMICKWTATKKKIQEEERANNRLRNLKRRKKADTKKKKTT